jgi:nitrite reductase (NO-forming)
MATTINNSGNGYGRRPVWQWVAIYIALALIVYGLYYLLVAKKNNSYSTIQPTQSSPVITTLPTLTGAPASSSASSVGALQTISPTITPLQVSVNGTEFAFSPSTITARVGQSVKLTFTNNGQFPHNFAIADLNIVTKTLSPGDKETISFTPETAGTFTYVCTVPGHADRGMKGTLTVTSP